MLRSMIIAAAAFIALPAHATTVTFDFRNVGAADALIGSSATFSDAGSGLSVDVFSMEQAGAAFFGARQIVRGDSGLGVFVRGDGAQNGSAGQLDGSGSRAEGLLFRFSAPVRLDSIVFGGVASIGNVQNNDNGSIFADLDGDGTGFFIQQEANLPLEANNPYMAMFGSLINGLLLGAPAANDDYYVTSLTITQMPVPAAGLLFGSALGLAGLYKRRKAKSVAAA